MANAAARQVLVVAGPTAVGKTALSLRLGQLVGRPCEVVSGDSVQVYRGLDIGTDKVSSQVRLQVPHHLIDCFGFRDSYSATDFARLAREHIEPDEGVLAAVRAELSRDASWTVSLAKLASLDPQYAATLSRNDYYRLERALAIVRMTKQPLSQARWPETVVDDDRCESMVVNGLVEVCAAPPRRLRALSNQKICKEKHLPAIIADHLCTKASTEVIRLRQAGLHLLCPAGRAIGYRQTLEFLLKYENYRPTDQAGKRAAFLAFVDELQQASRWRYTDGVEHRNYARRQWIWFRREPAFLWLDASELLQLDNSVRELVACSRAVYETTALQYRHKQQRAPFESSEGRKRTRPPEADDDPIGTPEEPLDVQRLMKTYRPHLRVLGDQTTVDTLLARIDAALGR